LTKHSTLAIIVIIHLSDHLIPITLNIIETFVNSIIDITKTPYKFFALSLFHGEVKYLLEKVFMTNNLELPDQTTGYKPKIFPIFNKNTAIKAEQGQGNSLAPSNKKQVHTTPF
jgi:hypothetical protein